MNSSRQICIAIFMLITNVSTMNAQHATANASLTLQQESIVSIAAWTAAGNTDSLQKQLNKGLDAGLTINEIKEMLVQLYAYCGFPRSLNAINALKTVLEQRKAGKITGQTGRDIYQNITADKYEQGRKVLETLTGIPQPKPAPGFGEFAPRIDAFLKEHLFADVFSSDVLSYQQRELTTIAALAAMTGVEAQLRSHVAMGRNTGLTDGALLQVAELIREHIGITQSNILKQILGQPTEPADTAKMMIRISEIEIAPEDHTAYNEILKEEAAISVKVEPGVIAIFPMYEQRDTNQVRIVEIYRDKAAYETHLRTPHFQHYKTSTVKMVRSLKLIDMESLDKETMLKIFEKL